jgi:NCAIR mutase (PurE)-related protein
MSDQTFVDVDVARIDDARLGRTGVPEVVYGAGKTAEQTRLALRALYERNGFALATRVREGEGEALARSLPEGVWDAQAGAVRCGMLPASGRRIAVLCAGTSDLPVTEEAAFTLEAFGHTVVRRRDVGVAGIHRLFSDFEEVETCDVVIVVAGMEGALPSVVAGLVAAPVIAVPTSVGYGAAFEGLAALLGMLNACAPGIAVVNIDNGFGAAAMAHKIVRANRAAETLA